VNDVSVPCIHDGKPSAPHGEHHVELRGMGGRGPKAPVASHERIPLCRACHRDLHEGGWAFRIEGDMVVGYQPNDPGWITFRRGLTLSEDGVNPAHWTDEKLATEWEQGNVDALKGLRRQCLVAAAFYQRYGWGEKWYEEAARFVSDFTGRHLDWRRMFERMRIYKVFGPSEEHPGGRWGDVDFLGATLALAVAESGEPEKALETAKVGRASLPPVPVRRIKAGLKGETIADHRREMCVCPDCGAEHTKKGGDAR